MIGVSQSGISGYKHSVTCYDVIIQQPVYRHNCRQRVGKAVPFNNLTCLSWLEHICSQSQGCCVGDAREATVPGTQFLRGHEPDAPHVGTPSAEQLTAPLCSSGGGVALAALALWARLAHSAWQVHVPQLLAMLCHWPVYMKVVEVTHYYNTSNESLISFFKIIAPGFQQLTASDSGGRTLPSCLVATES